MRNPSKNLLALFLKTKHLHGNCRAFSRNSISELLCLYVLFLFSIIVQYDDHLVDIKTCLHQHITFFYACWKGLGDFSGNDLLFFSEHRVISKSHLGLLSPFILVLLYV